jgi:hypothetical protein
MLWLVVDKQVHGLVIAGNFEKVRQSSGNCVSTRAVSILQRLQNAFDILIC